MSGMWVSARAEGMAAARVRETRRGDPPGNCGNVGNVVHPGAIQWDGLQRYYLAHYVVASAGWFNKYLVLHTVDRRRKAHPTAPAEVASLKLASYTRGAIPFRLSEAAVQRGAVRLVNPVIAVDKSTVPCIPAGPGLRWAHARGLGQAGRVVGLGIMVWGWPPPGRDVMIEDWMTVHMTEAEVARDLHAVLEKVRQGVEVVIEQNSRPVAVIRSPVVKGRKISEVIAALEASGANALLDEDFARDVEEGIRVRREPWNPPSWD